MNPEQPLVKPVSRLPAASELGLRDIAYDYLRGFITYETYRALELELTKRSKPKIKEPAKIDVAPPAASTGD